jgi:hypothetical protein
MALLPNNQKLIDEFFAAIAPFEAAYSCIGFSYLAIKIADRFIITHGRVFLNTSSRNPRAHFKSAHVRAGHYPLSELKLDVRTLVDRLLAGHVDTPHGTLHFPAESQHAASFVPFDPVALQTQVRHNHLTIMGGQMVAIQQPDIDWEVKAAQEPYDGLQELARDFGLGAPFGTTIQVAFLAYNVAAIDGPRSKVEGTNADVHILLAKGLSTDCVTLSYRSYALGSADRQSIDGGKMEWTQEAEYWRGRVSIQITNAAVLNCTVNYDGIAQAHFWLADPAHVQNPRRAVYEAFDPKLQNLQAIISGAGARGQDARSLEAAVAWIFWMLGFSGVQLGAIPKTQDAADLLMTTPAGHFAVVECTTGLLKAENKLALLHARAGAVHRQLDTSNNARLRVLPVIVTSRTRAEVTPDIEPAERLGIYIVTRESLEESITMTMIQHNADDIYNRAMQIVSAAGEQYKADGSVPPTGAL